jgi:hypothetical protein
MKPDKIREEELGLAPIVYFLVQEILVAGPRGFEPLQLASKARVLPLDDGPTRT